MNLELRCGGGKLETNYGTRGIGTEMNVRNSIRNKLIVFLLIAIILPISASIFISYFYTKHSLKVEAIRENSNTLHQGTVSMINQLNQINNISLYVYNNIQEANSLYGILLRGQSDFIVENQLYSGLHSIEQSAKDIQQVYLYSEWANKSYLLIDGYLKREPGRVGLEGHYIQPSGKINPYFEPPHPSHNYGMEEFPYSPSNTVLTIHRPVYRAPLKERIGILSIDFKLDGFRSISNMLYDKGNENIYLLDDNGTAIYASEENLTGQSPEYAWLEQAFLQSAPSGHFVWKETGGNGIVLYEKFKLMGRNWIIVKQIPNEYIYENASRVLQINMLVLVTFLSIAIAATLFVSVKLTAPIKKLTESIKKTKLGRLQLEIDSDRSDEVGLLGNAIKNMVDMINNLVMKELRLELANKDNQLKALQAQINPHFIYNTLQSIGSIALHNNVPKIYEMIASLGLMMRYNMKTEETVVPLSKELAHMNAYLELQKQRFKERLHFRIETDESILDIQVPKMVLQPIVENCFKHGFTSNMETFEITIAVQTAEDLLRISIADNGTGAAEERLQVLKRKIEREASDTASEGSIGLINVVSRLRLYFDAEVRVSIANLKPSGFSVMIDIPFRKEA